MSSWKNNTNVFERRLKDIELPINLSKRTCSELLPRHTSGHRHEGASVVKTFPPVFVLHSQDVIEVGVAGWLADSALSVICRARFCSFLSNVRLGFFPRHPH